MSSEYSFAGIAESRPARWQISSAVTGLIPVKLVDRFGDRHGFFFQQACESIRIDGERIGLVHGIRDKVFAAGQDFPHGAHLGGDVFDAVDDLSVRCAEDDIAVLPPMISTISSLRHRSPSSSRCSIVKWMIRSSFGCRISTIRPPPMCLRRSMQKFGAVMGAGLFASVR